VLRPGSRSGRLDAIITSLQSLPNPVELENTLKAGEFIDTLNIVAIDLCGKHLVQNLFDHLTDKKPVEILVGPL